MEIEPNKTPWHVKFPWQGAIVVLAVISSLIYNEHRISIIETAFADHKVEDQKFEDATDAFRNKISDKLDRIESKIDHIPSRNQGEQRDFTDKR